MRRRVAGVPLLLVVALSLSACVDHPDIVVLPVTVINDLPYRIDVLTCENWTCSGYENLEGPNTMRAGEVDDKWYVDGGGVPTTYWIYRASAARSSGKCLTIYSLGPKVFRTSEAVVPCHLPARDRAPGSSEPGGNHSG